MFSGSERLSRTDNVSVREVDGEGVLFNEEDGSLHILNGSSMFIWQLLDGQVSLNSLAEKVADHFAISTTEARDDVYDLANKLTELHLVEIKDGANAR